MSIKPEELKPCPFCGLELDMSDGDTVYPTGAGWKDEGEHRSYHNMHAVPDGQWCWGVNCRCGAGLSGDSRAEAIIKWNTRAIPDTHRVVSVELLRKAMSEDLSIPGLYDEMRAIIEDKP